MKPSIELYDYVYRPTENIAAVIFKQRGKPYKAMELVPFFENKKLLYALPPKDMARICCIAVCIMLEASHRVEVEFMAKIKKSRTDKPDEK